MKWLSKTCVVALLVCVGLSVFADDGMWMPHQMKDLNLETLGLQMNPEDLYKEDGTGLMSAVVSLGGGTGEFVSRDGLILTNHHVAFRALQRAATPEHDYITDGFVAWSREEEIPAMGYIADVLLGYEEITERMLSAVSPGMTYGERYGALDKAEKAVIAEAEKEGEDIRCRVASMYSGNQYFLFRFKRLKDVRIVYAPPRDLGNFGGDVDNWMWPRHTCDFTFLRAYVSKDGVGMDYHPDNVPYRPKSVIKISLDGVEEGDFTFVMGYPGRTYRNYAVSELMFEMERMERRVDFYRGLIGFFEEAGQGSQEVTIKYAGNLRGLNNALKNYVGKLEGFNKASVVERKTVVEKGFADWINADAKRKSRYAGVVEKIDGFMRRYSDFYWRNQSLTQLVSGYFGPALVSQGYLVYRMAKERKKPDMDRDAYYQERNWSNIRERVQLAERGYDLATDRAFFKFLLKRFFAFPEDQIPAALKNVVKAKSEQAVDAYVDALYSKTSLADPNRRLTLLDMSLDEMQKLDDPLLRLAAELEKEIERLREKEEVLNQERLELKKMYLEGFLAYRQGKIAPDANGTIRFTHGTVEGYSPRDAVYYLPLTTLKGVIEKNTGAFPFDVPNKLKQLYADKDFGVYADTERGEVPTCFLNTTNVTGGSSGSPTLNAKGEQVGVIFDMTYESVIGDYYILPEFQRTISVDIRYVLFVAEKFSGVEYLLKEMGL